MTALGPGTGLEGERARSRTPSKMRDVRGVSSRAAKIQKLFTCFTGDVNTLGRFPETSTFPGWDSIRHLSA